MTLHQPALEAALKAYVDAQYNPLQAAIVAYLAAAVPDDARLDALTKIAEAATQKKWSVEDPMGPEVLSIVAYGDKPVYEWRHIAQVSTDDERGPGAIHKTEMEGNAKHIAAFDPPTALELLASIRAMKAQMGEAQYRDEDGTVRTAKELSVLLDGRDQFLVESDMFSKFVDWTRTRDKNP